MNMASIYLGQSPCELSSYNNKDMGSSCLWVIFATLNILLPQIHLHIWHRNLHETSTDIKRPAYDETPLCSVGKIVRARAFLASVCCWFPSIQLMHNMKLVEEAQFRYKFPGFFVDKGSKKSNVFLGDSAFRASTPCNGGICGRKRWHCSELRTWIPKTLKEKMQWWMSWHSWHLPFVQDTVYYYTDTGSDFMKFHTSLHSEST